ncbi:VPLPA-CTERM sorting domain-containing protein [Tateyamaria sp.]|uniref:VPLPA-CTERM sorting domain-containing protein n=1 Tax=Tateyamaria sp. TaxID=1929288 RepID=UPI0039B967E3
MTDHGPLSHPRRRSCQSDIYDRGLRCHTANLIPASGVLLMGGLAGFSVARRRRKS